MLRGARMAPVGKPSGISVDWNEKLGMNVAGNSFWLMFACDANRWPSPKAHVVIAPGDQFARSIHAALQVMEPGGTIEIVRHIVFTGPQELHRHAGLLGDPGGLGDVVVGEPPSETTAAANLMKRDVARLQSERLHSDL